MFPWKWQNRAHKHVVFVFPFLTGSPLAPGVLQVEKELILNVTAAYEPRSLGCVQLRGTHLKHNLLIDVCLCSLKSGDCGGLRQKEKWENELHRLQTWLFPGCCTCSLKLLETLHYVGQFTLNLASSVFLSPFLSIAMPYIGDKDDSDSGPGPGVCCVH